MKKLQQIDHELTEDERKAIKHASKESIGHFSDFVAKFMHECEVSGVDSNVAAASLSLLATSNLVRLVLMASGMPTALIDEATMPIGAATQEFLTDQINVFILAQNRRHARDRN